MGFGEAEVRGTRDEMIDESIFHWFGHIERMESSRYESRAVDRCRKWWIGSVNDFEKKRSVRHVRSD